MHGQKNIKLHNSLDVRYSIYCDFYT